MVVELADYADSREPRAGELPRVEPQSGDKGQCIEILAGDLRDVSMNSLVQLAEAESLSGWLVVHDRGKIGVFKGRVTSAECGGLSGLDALRALMFLTAGRYSVQRGAQQITTPLPGLVLAVMDTFRLREEWTRISGLVLRVRGAEQWRSNDPRLDRLVSALDGRRTLAEVVADPWIEVTSVLDPLLDVIDAGLLVPVPTSPSAPECAPPPAEPVEPPQEEDFDALLAQGRALVRAGDLDGAEDVFLRAIVLRPDDRTLQQNLRAVSRRRETLRMESSSPWK